MVGSEWIAINDNKSHADRQTMKTQTRLANLA
jgi:hypothetical protein